MTTNNRTLIFIPTYNESENVEKLFLEIKSLSLVADILFLDDNSPDGTGVIIDNIVGNTNNVFVIHRIGKLGIGSAHKEGIQWAYNHNYDVLITMDCDFTHSPKYIIDFINYSINHDIVIGSKYLEKNSLKTWCLYRKALTHLGHFLTSTLLHMPFDSTGAFRLYNINKIPKGVFGLIKSNSYSFFFESLFILNINKYTICEFPICVPSRTYGSSKMSVKDIFTSLKYLGSIYMQTIVNKRNFIYKD
jgi:dolichol-phosphate mannosyltransferase